MQMTVRIPKRIKVFLGGTCNGSKWREELIPNLNIEYFNPVVEEWTEECKVEEKRQRSECDLRLYVITPSMTGVLSIAELVEDSILNSSGTVVCFLKEYEGKSFSDHQWSSLESIVSMVTPYGVEVFFTLTDTANALNLHAEMNQKRK